MTITAATQLQQFLLTSDIQKRFLLACKTCIRKVFGYSAGTYSDINAVGVGDPDRSFAT